MSRLPPQIIKAIKESNEPVQAVAARLGVSVSTVGRHTRRRRNHLTDLERDQVVREWLAGIPTQATAKRFGIDRHTIYRIRAAAHKLVVEAAAHALLEAAAQEATV